MERENFITPLFRLEFIRHENDMNYYRITGADEPVLSVQNISFNTADYSIMFLEPVSCCYDYLHDNEKWLRSILCTTLKTEKLNGLSIPFSFPVETPEPDITADSLMVYCDGACSAAGRGGWGGVIIIPGSEPVEISGHEENTTSNRMELAAAVNSLRKAEYIINDPDTPVILLTDSQYVIQGITHRLQVWRRNGFITATGKPVINIDLWIELEEIMKRIKIRCVKTDSTADNNHRRCDGLAAEEIKRG